MKSLDIPIRNLSEAMTRFAESPFLGDSNERSYLLGFAVGDLFVARHGLCVRVTVSTTHPAMIELMSRVFGSYGRITVRPKFLKRWNQFEWEVYTYLHPSFNFLLRKSNIRGEQFLPFFAGIFDAEGNISIRKQERSKTARVALEVTNSDKRLLELCFASLIKLGYHPAMPPKPKRKKGEIVGYGRYDKDLWSLSVTRKAEVVQLLSIMPVKHREKVWKKELAIDTWNKPWVEVSDKVRRMRHLIREEVKASVAAAREAKLQRWSRRSSK